MKDELNIETLAKLVCETMAPKTNLTEELVIALRDRRVQDALAEILEAKLQPLLVSIAELQADNARKSAQIGKLQEDLQSATARVEALEIYSRRDNLLITGLPIDSYADSAGSGAEGESSQALELAVLKLFNQQLGLPTSPTDLSIVHRLKKARPSDPRPATTMVRFTNRKAREAVYSARRQLKRSPTPIFINEDLNKSTAELFHQARQLVQQKMIHSTWTSSCVVYIKDTGEPNCRPRKISSLDDLPRSM